uniref:Uncharacterized protein n=1 Tax=viral metagenome TaxID=1070528 RepID=A0A6M3JIK2_9ZZZZ
MNDKLWSDLTTNKEKAEFLRSGRAVATGIIAPAIVEEVASVFEFKSKLEFKGSYNERVICSDRQ